MPYLIDTTIPADRARLREGARPAHLAYLEANAERLLAAGAKLPDADAADDGSFYLIEVETRHEAELFLAADPYMLTGLITAARYTRVRKGFFNHRRVVPPAGN
jgi:uncharacterized protein